MTTTPHDGAELYRTLGDAWENDPAYRALLVADPRKALAGKGLELPEDVELRVHVDSGGTTYCVFPPDPNTELTDDALAAVHGGAQPSSAGSIGSVGSVGCAPSCISSASTVGTIGSASCEDTLT